METKYLLYLSVLGNFVSVVILIILVSVFGNGGDYFRFGPNEDLYIIGIHVDNYHIYFSVVIVILFLASTEVLVNEVASPILGFSIYNPDKKEITEFSKNELQLLANTQFFINSLRYTISILVTITQIDIAFYQMIAKEITSIITIRYLLNQKTFNTI